MENKIIIGKWEATALIINGICTQILLNFPRSMAEAAGNAGWILISYISIIAILAFFIIIKLYKKFEGMDILDIAGQATGEIGRIIFGLIVFALIFGISAITLREFGEDMKVISLNLSPISYIMMFFIVGMITAAYFGLEAILRLNAIMVPTIIAGYLIIIIAVAPYYDFANLTPIFGTGLNDIFIWGSVKLSTYSALIYLFLITPFLKKYKNIKSVGYFGLVFSAILLISSAFAYLSVSDYPTSKESFLPIYQLARLINYGRFFQRIEPVFIFIWSEAALLYLGSGLFFCSYVLKKTFGLKYYKPLILPITIILFCTSLLPESLIASVNIETKYFRKYVWIITFGLTIIILMIASIRKKNKEKRQQNVNK